MISDSNIWRVELWRDVEDLRRWLRHAATPKSRGVTEGLLAKIEKFSFTSAFIVRKLMDAWKLSDELENARLPIHKYPVIDDNRLIDYLNCHRGPEFYDFSKGNEAHVLPRDLCNLLIHSMVFCPVLTEDQHEVIGLLFNSDRTKYENLFEINLDVYLAFIDDVIGDQIVSAHYHRFNGTVFKSREITKASIEGTARLSVEGLPPDWVPAPLTRASVEQMARLTKGRATTT